MTNDARITRNLRNMTSGAILIGIVLALADGLLHGSPAAWAQDPAATARAIVYLAAAYAAAAALAAIVLPWRVLVCSLFGGFTALQALLSLRRADLGGGFLEMTLGLTACLAVAIAAAWLALLVLGRRGPRPRLLGAALGLAAVLGVAGWIVGDDPTTQSFAAAPQPSRHAATAPSGKPLPNVLLLTLDTLRADRVGAYGYEGVETPNMDRLADDGALFLHAIVQASTTPPSHASIMTGVTPVKHGVRAFEGGYTLATEYRTLAEILGEAGYATGAVISSIPLAPGYGIERGFADYDFELPSRQYAFYGFRDALAPRVLRRLQLVRDPSGYRNAQTQTDRALAWLAERGDGPFFLWVHYFDVHDPYVAPLRHLKTEAHPGSSPVDLLKRSYLYDSEVSYLDEEIGRLVGHLKRANLLDRTIVAAIADHGEALGEHGYVGHSTELYQEQLRVPFFMRYPPAITPGARLSTQVRSIDLLPTVLDLTALPNPGSIEGKSLLPLIDGREQHDRRAFAETVAGPSRRLVSVSDGRYKMIAAVPRGREELYDLLEDPGEQRNLIHEHDAVAARLRREIRDYLARAVKRDDEKVTLQQTTRQRLRALGYLD